MKPSLPSLGLMASLATAAPTPTVDEGMNFAEVAKRDSIMDVSLHNFLNQRLANINPQLATGYASEDGGTTGGAGETSMTASTYPRFTAAVSGRDKKAIVDGAIT